MLFACLTMLRVFVWASCTSPSTECERRCTEPTVRRCRHIRRLYEYKLPMLAKWTAVDIDFKRLQNIVMCHTERYRTSTFTIHWKSIKVFEKLHGKRMNSMYQCVLANNDLLKTKLQCIVTLQCLACNWAAAAFIWWRSLCCT